MTPAQAKTMMKSFEKKYEWLRADAPRVVRSWDGTGTLYEFTLHNGKVTELTKPAYEVLYHFFRCTKCHKGFKSEDSMPSSVPSSSILPRRPARGTCKSCWAQRGAWRVEDPLTKELKIRK